MIYWLASVHGRTSSAGRAEQGRQRSRAVLPSPASERGSPPRWWTSTHRGRHRRGRVSASSDTPAVISGHADQLPALLTAARDAGANLAIIDTAPHSTDAALAAARAADLVLIPCRASVADLHAIGTSIEITRQAGTAAAVILNAAPVQGSLVDQALAAIAGYEVEMVPVVLHHRIAHVHAFTDGLAAPELTRDSQAGTELTAVFRWVQKKERSLNG